MYVDDRPLTFADLSKAVQRSAGLGQAYTCADGSSVGNALDCFPIESPGNEAAATNVFTGINNAATGQVSIFGVTMPGWAAYTLGGFALVIALGAFSGGRR